MRPQTFDREKIHLNLARLRKGGHNFEIVIDPDKAFSFIRGEGNITISEILEAPNIFSDAKKGELASEHLLEEIFNTKDPEKIAEIILREGEIQLTVEHQRKLLEEKRRRIIELIHRNTCDPRTGLPHPIVRIENALEEAKVRIDPAKKEEEQLSAIVEKLKPIIPIKIAKKVYEVIIPAQYAARSYGEIKKFGVLKKDEWANDGSWHGIIEVPAGVSLEMIDAINSLAKGSAEVKELKEE